MLPGLGFSEILVVGLIALLVVGPKDLPLMLRKLGRITAKLRAMGQDLRAGFDEIARQAELDELKKEVDALRRHQALTDLQREITPPGWTPPAYEGPVMQPIAPGAEPVPVEAQAEPAIADHAPARPAAP
jgi:sec-independent protein translocase protein TatB